MSTKLYVGNLPFSMNEDDLKELFSSVGKVFTVKIVTNHQDGRSRGYGFVEMSNGFEADQAVTQLNGKEILGRFVRVDRAKSSQTTMPRRPQPAASL